MSTVTQNNPAQTLVDILGFDGPLKGTEVKQKSGLDQNTLQAVVGDLMRQGIITRDGDTFDVTLDYRSDERLAQGTQQAAPVAVARPARAAAPAPAKAAAPAKAPAKVKAPAKAAAPATEGTEKEPRTLYYTRAMDQIPAVELEWMVGVGMEAAANNWAEGTEENKAVAEMLERWCRRAERAIKSEKKGTRKLRAIKDAE